MATMNESLFEGYVMPDNVLIEILLRLPLLSLQLFKSVSKHWLSLITSEYFTRRLRKPRIETPCGLFIRKEVPLSYNFVTLGPKVTSFPLSTITDEAGRHLYIMCSCNGLFLCNNGVSSKVYYYVYNPFTNLCKNIPFALKHSCTSMKLAFDPTKSPYYKVVVTGNKPLDWYWGEDWEQYWEQDPEEDWDHDPEEDWEHDREDDIDTQQILIYSSESGKWRICGSSLHKDWLRGFAGGIYWNNAIHWIRCDDGWLLHSKFDIVDYPIITNIQTLSVDAEVDMSLYTSRSSLLLLMKDYDCCYHVFEMMEESSKWSVKYIIDDIVNILPDLYGRLIKSCVLCIIWEERGDDSFMVIESDDKIVRYNFVSKTISTICNLSCDIFRRVPFIASLAGV